MALDEICRRDRSTLKAELEETQRSLREVTLMIEQSQMELAKLTQRNAAITAHLQTVQKQIGQLPAEEVRMAYDSALDAQQRLVCDARSDGKTSGRQDAPGKIQGHS